MRKVTFIRWIVISLLLVLAIIVFWPAGSSTVFAQPPDEAPVTFPDPILEAVIRKHLKKHEGAIYASDLKSLNVLTYQGGGRLEDITDLTGLEYCTNLQELRLYAIQISDISAISGLTNLQRFELGESQISDISPLSNLTSLTYLSLGANQIRDISPLGSLTNLERLSLYLSQVSDLSGLSGLTNLRTLLIYSEQISDLSGLSGLTNLRTLLIYSEQISDLSGLSGLTNLKQLGIQRSQISDLSPLSSLKSLTTIDLSNNQISDISALSGLTNLQGLSLNYNQISDISPLAGLSALRVVELEMNPLSAASLEIYIPLLRIKGVNVQSFSKPTYLKFVIFTALALVAIGILITMWSVRSWGVAPRVLQLAIIIIVSGLAFYVTPRVYSYDDALLVCVFASILLGFGTVITFWSLRDELWNLLGCLLILMAICPYFIVLASAPALGTAGVLFILRRSRLEIAIGVSIFVGLVLLLIRFALIALASLLS